MNGASNAGFSVYKPIYKRWWFWVGVVVLGIVAFYVKGYINWQAQGAQYDEYARATAEYVAQQKAQSAALEKAYREDMYGGATPEETLKLYVEALEKGDFELASRYYIAEEQSEIRMQFDEMEKNDSLTMFISILKYRTEVAISDDKQRAQVSFFDAKGIQSNVEFLQINPFTQKWKLYTNQ